MTAIKTVGIMQPYFFPYIGYFQLISAVDRFVFFDDVQYIKRRWINRNRVLRDGQPLLVTLPLIADRHEKFISERVIVNPKQSFRSITACMENAYRRAPYFSQTMELLRSLFEYPETSIARFNISSVTAICRHIGITTEFVVSSTRNYDRTLKAEDRVIHICQREGASTYINPIGARTLELYSAETFGRFGIDLLYLETREELSYAQTGNPFSPHLSIIDVLMFNPAERIGDLLKMYRLLPPA
jgi:WbqC-like protein family